MSCASQAEGIRELETPAVIDAIKHRGTCPHQMCKLDVASNGEQKLNPYVGWSSILLG